MANFTGLNDLVVEDEDVPVLVSNTKYDLSQDDVQCRMCTVHGDYDKQTTCKKFIESSYHRRCTFTNEFNPMCTYSEVMYENMANFKPFRCK